MVQEQRFRIERNNDECREPAAAFKLQGRGGTMKIV
jgi:hypothetical protein